MSKKLEYDSALGGPVVLPTHVPTYRYAAAALNEMKDLISEVRNPNNRKLVFQTLPKHMRRRAVSHYPHRLPRKYRNAHISQMSKSGPPRVIKRRSRKYRRRPKNLLSEYIRRQRRHVWLETHIWHARRFHMVERWGYRLPYASFDKMYRACYRASANHCLVQDLSFNVCLQLQGTLKELEAGFRNISSNKCGLGITAKTFVGGRREGTIDLFKDGQYPFGALGRASYIWCPLNTAKQDITDDSKRILWLWIHPSAYLAVVEELIKVFELIVLKGIKTQLKSEMEDKETAELNSDKNKEKNTVKQKKKISMKNVRQLQFVTKSFAYERIKRYGNPNTGIELQDLKDTMNRFRLTGPLSQAVLTHAFKVKQVEATKTESTDWFHTSLKEQNDFQIAHNSQCAYWEQCANVNSPDVLLSNMIIALNIEDPRINRPNKRTKALPQPTTSIGTIPTPLFTDIPVTLPHSVLWDASLRHHICEQKLSTQAYCELREKRAVVPGEKCAFEKELQPVPVLLIQRPGSQNGEYKRLAYGCGWDVIVPSGYGMPVWLSLIMWGAKPGGLREFESIARELGIEQHLPDTVSGRQIAIEKNAELQAKYFRLPPNKRCNYRKCSIVSPFRVPFAELLRDWLPKTVDGVEVATSLARFHVLRDRTQLEGLNLWLQGKEKAFPENIPNECLVQLQLRMLTRGNADNFAVLSLPTRSDFKRHLKYLKRESNEPVYTEPLCEDLNAKERRVLRLDHKKLLKRLRGRRVREKRKLQETSTKRVYIRPAGTAQLRTAQFKKMCSLWLPEDCSTLYTVRKQGTREVFGYMTNASFSYIEATVCGIAYATVQGLQQLHMICQKAHVKQLMCLVRGTKTRHYRFARTKLCLQI